MIRFNLATILAEYKRDGVRFTYADIANSIGVHENTIYNIVNNRVKSINLNTLNALCNLLHVGPEKILFWTPDGTESDEASERSDAPDAST